MDPILLKPPIELHPAGEPVDLQPADPVPPSLPEADLDHAANPQSGPTDQTLPLAGSSVDTLEASPDATTRAVERVVAKPPDHIVLGPARGPLGQLAEVIAYLSSRVFGAIALIVALALLAAYPALQVISLGYLLESAGRIGRTGRFRDAFPLVPQASRIGGAVLGGWLFTLPWRYVSDLLADSILIDPSSTQTGLLSGLLKVLNFAIPLHILFALLRGGRLRYYFWPFNVVWFVRRIFQGGYFQEAWSATASVFRELRIVHFFYLGLRGGLGALAWLAIPSTLYAVGKSGAAGLLGFLGGILLTIVVLYVPFLQVHFAAENRWKAMFEVRAVRARFRKAPIAFFIAFLFTLVLVLPLYLLKIQVVPRDALWLPSLVFVVTIFPLKILTGWAYGWAGRKHRDAHWIFRIPCRVLMLPVALLYSIVVFFTQYTGWEGVRALYEHHAFLLPVPFSAPFLSGN